VGNAVKVFLLTLSARFPSVDPHVGSLIFLAMTQEYSPRNANGACLAGFREQLSSSGRLLFCGRFQASRA